MNFDILRYLADHAGKIFIETHDLSLTYRQSLHIVKYLAAELTRRGLFGQKILLSVPHTHKSHLLFLAVLHTNNVILVHPDHNRSFLQHIIREAGVDSVICDQALESTVPCILMHDLLGALYWPAIPDSDWNQWYPGRLSLLSSGTTGTPKSIDIDYQRIMPYGNLLLDWLPLQEQDRLYFITPFYHGFGLTRLFSVLQSGSAMFVPSSQIVKDMIADINRRRCTWTSLVPRMVRIAAKSGMKLWEGFRFTTCSAAPVSADLLSQFSAVTSKPIYVEYGCTEASIISSNTPAHDRPGSLGRIDPARCEIRQGSIWVRPGFDAGAAWLDTGDIGWIDDDGFLWLQGRAKEVIKRNGRTVFPFEIECALQDASGLVEVVAYSRNAMTDHEDIGLVYVGDLNSDQMMMLCRQRLPMTCQPSRITKVPFLPLHCGKIRRSELEQYVDAL
jgi:acyl-CoA synthetase (AMP-forming)/AMP-acid ligase II